MTTAPASDLALRRAARQALIDTANERMRIRKVAAFDAYGRVHRTSIHRCREACREAHRVLLGELSDANAEYSSAIREDH